MAAVDGVLEQANGFHERDIGVQLPAVEPLDVDRPGSREATVTGTVGC